MIWFFKLDRAIAGSCENYDDLFQYIIRKEKLKLLESHEFGRPSWSFTSFTPQQVSYFYEKTKQPSRTKIVKEAYEKESGFIVLHQGDPENFIEILATSDLDIEIIKKQWCLEYCKVHNYLVVENSFHTTGA
jgi:hypothetical protein